MLPPRPDRRRRRRIGWCRGATQGSDVGGWFESTALGIEGEMTEMHVGKMQFGLPRWVEPQTDMLAGERIADVVVAAFVSEVAGGGDDFDLLVWEIDQRLVILAQASAAGLVKLGRRVLIE